MAKKRPKQQQVTEALAVEVLRKNWQRLLQADGVTSCGVGYRQQAGERTDEICIQCTVKQKYTLEVLKAREMKPLPEYVQDEAGNRVGVDVVQRQYKLAHELEMVEEEVEEEVDYRALRRSRLDPIAPGASVSHVEGTAGTIGAIVFDKESGRPLILSNWHVLQGHAGEIGDDVVQPGPFDDSEVFRNHCGQLVRSHLGLAGDCAVASIDGRDWEEEIIQLAVTPRRMARPNLEDLVVKSGRTTGVTYGIVERVNVVAKLDYGGDVGVQAIGGFEIRPNPDKPPENGEISMGGDSGSVWMLDAADEADADIVLGLHFAGESDPAPEQEHALACLIPSVAKKLDIAFEPPAGAVDSEAMLWQEVFSRLQRVESQVDAQPRRECRCRTIRRAQVNSRSGDSISWELVRAVLWRRCTDRPARRGLHASRPVLRRARTLQLRLRSRASARNRPSAAARRPFARPARQSPANPPVLLHFAVRPLRASRQPADPASL